MNVLLAPSRWRRKDHRQSGSAVLAGLGILAITLIAVGAALFEASNRFRTSHHSTRWSQAGQAAEAGAEIAMMTAQKDSWTADGWSGAPGAVGAAAVTKTVTLSTGVSSIGPTSTSLSVDKINMNGSEWLRIRSRGLAQIAGVARAGIDTRDVMLRKLSLRKDRGTGAALSNPQAIRTVEILAEPQGATPFKYAFLSKELFDIHAHTMVDSYDSSNSAKSNFGPFGTYGVYTLGKRQQHGDVGTLDASNTWNFNDAYIYGDALTPTGDVDHTANLQGNVQTGFTTTIEDEVSPNWTTVTQNHGNVVNVNKTIVGGTESSPPRHKMTSIDLSSDNKKIRLQNPAGMTESWVEVWVTGDTKIEGKNLTGIQIDPGVHATIYFGAKVEINGGGGGYAIQNGSQLPANLIIRAYGGSSGSTQDFMLKDTDFWGLVSAPWYKVKFDLTNKNVHGSFIAWQFDVSDYTLIHYDESLSSLSVGQSSNYTVKSWVEAVR